MIICKKYEYKCLEHYYIEATERIPVAGDDDGALGFSPSTCCCVPLLLTLACANQSTCCYNYTNILANRMSRLLERNMKN
jgi:hypothetical protein